MMPLRRAALPILAVVAFTAPAGADHCIGPTTSEPEVALGPYYLREDCHEGWCGEGSIFSLWLYEETNGMQGLQRGDEFVDDTCHATIAPDTIVF